jgi:anaerobic magnesium-protoporphyrin IX monomethyl ester cyclase
MKKQIDCLLIGHNEMDFEKYEDICVKMGVNSGVYRDLNLNYIRYNNKPYTAADFFNLLNDSVGGGFKPLKMGETFSAAISCLGSYLNRNGLRFDYVNSFQDKKTQLAETLTHENILTIAIITTLYVVPLPIMEIIGFIKKYNRTAKIIVGGPFVSTQVRTLDAGELEYLWTAIDADFFVNSSQGEAALVKIIRALKNNLPVRQIENIYYKSGSKYAAAPIKIEDNKLSENPVKWDLFSHQKHEYVNVRTTISCPYSCSFCGFPEHAGKYQVADIEWVQRQLNQLNRINTLKSVHFIDDTFNVPMERFKEILKRMIKNKYRFKWHSYFRCQFASREIVEMMKESGCDGVFLGLESGSEQILKNMNKASNLSKYFEGIALLKEASITTFGSFITGFPGETDETVQDTIKFIEKSGLDFYRTQLWYCEPITPIWKEREKYKIKGEHFEWSHATMNSRVACDRINEIFLSIKNSLWIPYYDFDFVSIWHLVHRAIPLGKVMDFLKGFNRGIKEKLMNPAWREVSFEVIEELGRIYRRDQETGPSAFLKEDENIVNKYDAEFDY